MCGFHLEMRCKQSKALAKQSKAKQTAVQHKNYGKHSTSLNVLMKNSQSVEVNMIIVTQATELTGCLRVLPVLTRSHRHDTHKSGL